MMDNSRKPFLASKWYDSKTKRLRKNDCLVSISLDSVIEQINFASSLDVFNSMIGDLSYDLPSVSKQVAIAYVRSHFFSSPRVVEYDLRCEQAFSKGNDVVLELFLLKSVPSIYRSPPYRSFLPDKALYISLSK
jgi:hypothetical protein